ncbi:MAG: lipopolysaccharide biosynthesis protein [bacterium]
MINSLKRLTKHSAVYGIGHIVTRSVNFLLLPLYTNKLPTRDFGAFAVIFSFLALTLIVYTYGMDTAFLRHFVLSEEKNKRRQIFSTAFWSVASVTCILTCLIYVKAAFFSRMFFVDSAYAHLFRLTSLILFFDALSTLPFLFLRAEEKSVQFALLKFVNVIVNVTFNIILIVQLHKGVAGIFLANVYASAITFLLLIPILVKQISLLFNRKAFKELLRFGLPYLPSTMAVVLLDLVDRFILEKLTGLDVVGVYHAGYKLGTFMALFVAAFRFAWHPFFLSISKQENAKDVYARVLTYFTTIGAWLFLLVSVFIEDIVRFKIGGLALFGQDYWAGTRIVPLILLSYLTYGIYVNFVVGIYLEKKTKYLPAITGAGAGVNILANFLLIPKFGMMGSAYATLLGYLVMAALLYAITRGFYKVEYEFKRIAKLGLVVAALFYFGYYSHGSWEILTKVSLLLGFPLLLLSVGFFERREVNKIRGMLRLGQKASS